MKREFYMSAYVLLNLLNELRGKRYAEHFNLFFAMSLINSIIQDHGVFIT